MLAAVFCRREHALEVTGIMMSARAQPVTVNSEQIVQKIREQVRQRLEAASRIPDVVPPSQTFEVSTALIDGLRSVTSDVAQQSGNIGQPTPGLPSFRGRVGSCLMRLLGRVLWWYTYHLQAFASAAQRLFREQIKVMETMMHSINSVHHSLSALKQEEAASREELLECKRELRQVKLRLQELEAAHLGVQPAEFERVFSRLDRLEQQFRACSSEAATTDNR